MRRRDSLAAQTNRFALLQEDPFLSSLLFFPRVEAGKESLSRFIGREWELGTRWMFERRETRKFRIAWPSIKNTNVIEE